jgi:hypothetical protein
MSSRDTVRPGYQELVEAETTAAISAGLYQTGQDRA